MTRKSDNWSLFGLDLRRVIDFARLGFNQLCFDKDSWLLKHFDLPVRAISQSGESLGTYLAGRCVSTDVVDSTTQHAIVLDDSSVLCKLIRLPRQRESELDSVVALDVGSSTPFPQTETVFGYVVSDRNADFIEVTLAISNRGTIADALMAMPAVSATEVWARSSSGLMIVFDNEMSRQRRREYLGRVYRLFGNALLVWMAALLVLLIPVAFVFERASMLEDNLAEVRRDAQPASRAREQLVIERARLDAVDRALKARPNYHAQLNEIAARTPDTVFFERLGLDGLKVEAAGLSDNAAAYFGLLTKQENYINVRALSAFTQDAWLKQERFVIAWEYDDLTQGDDT